MVKLLLKYNANTKIKNFFGTSPHDAMYEVEDMDETIRILILGRSMKRKFPEDKSVNKARKKEDIDLKLKEEKKVGFRTYARLEKITNVKVLENLSNK